MKFKLRHDQRTRQMVHSFEEVRRFYKSQSLNLLLSEDERFDFLTRLRKLPRRSSTTRVKNRCAYTGRTRGIISKYRISRGHFSKVVKVGGVSGLRKASWLWARFS